jgi:hypothetical protein
MRATKYRGLRKDNGEYAYGDLCTQDWQEAALIGVWNEELRRCDWIPVDHETAGQFTGLTDKNKAEIYEGDICALDDISGIVIWKDSGFDIEFRKGEGYNRFIQDRARKFTVIGSIHTHPDLLKQKV